MPAAFSSPMPSRFSRRLFIRRASLAALGAAAAPAALAQNAFAAPSTTDERPAMPTPAQPLQLTQEWDKTFPQSPRVEHRKVQFGNRYGIALAGDLYLPKALGAGKLAAIIVSGPFGAVKEQSSGLHAQTLAERGFATLAFDPSFTGESGGAVRDAASPDIFSEDFSAAVDFMGLQPQVDRARIGLLGICGLSGMAVTAAATDLRVKAVATTAMYDMSRSMSRGPFHDNLTPAQRQQVKQYLAEQRWRDAESGRFARDYHEAVFDAQGHMQHGDVLLPAALPPQPNPVLARFHSYYRQRAHHRRAINSNSAWTASTPTAFFSFPLMANIQELAPRPLLLVAGENAHSRYYSEDAHKAAAAPKELLIVPGADHVDLYDNLDKIPFDRFESFFKTHLK